MLLAQKGEKKQSNSFAILECCLYAFLHGSAYYLLLFFSLDWSVTKNQILNIKCQQRFLLSFQFEKRQGSFQIDTKAKAKFIKHLVFNIWLLVNDLSNELNIHFRIYVA